MQIHSNYGVGDKELFPANRNLMEEWKMNRLTKIAIWLGLVGLGLLLLVIASGVAHPNPLFNYGSVIGLLLLVFSIFFFVIGWVFDMKCEVKRKNWIGVAILLIAAVLFLYSFLN